MSDQYKKVFGLSVLGTSLCMISLVVHLISKYRLLHELEPWSVDFYPFDSETRDIRIALAMIFGTVALISYRIAHIALAAISVCFTFILVMALLHGSHGIDFVIYILIAIAILGVIVLSLFEANRIALAVTGLLYVIAEYVWWYIQSPMIRERSESLEQLRSAFSGLIGSDWWHISIASMTAFLLVLNIVMLYRNSLTRA